MSSYSALTVPTQFVEVNGIRFAYRRWGKPDRPIRGQGTGQAKGVLLLD
jgi:hypothetical protein